MASITITIPDAVAPKVLAAFVSSFGGKRQKDETDQQLTKRMLQEYIKSVYIAAQVATASSTAGTAAQVQAAAEINNLS